MMWITLLAALLITVAQATFAQDASMPISIYEKAPTGTAHEIAESFNGQRIIRNVTTPTLTAFLPDAGHATGAAVIVAPGGGFMMLSIDSEGRKVATWLADHGIAAFVLKYRMKETPADTAAFSHELMAVLTKAAQGPAPENNESLAIADGKAAVKFVRDRAQTWNVDPNRIGFLGFSAGAVVALQTAPCEDESSRPAFVAPIYGPMDRVTVPSNAPPLFVAMAANDPIFGGKGFGLVDAWIAAKRPAELHVFAKGGHGFGMNSYGFSSDHWIDEFYWWMQASGFLGAHSH